MAVINLKDIPDKLRNEFKAVCALEGIAMKEAIIKFMEKAVKEGKLKL
jgi:antitoxin component of RelBE/YafQ-DinJ toxin-antitoxin module